MSILLHLIQKIEHSLAWENHLPFKTYVLRLKEPTVSYFDCTLEVQQPPHISANLYIGKTVQVGVLSTQFLWLHFVFRERTLRWRKHFCVTNSSTKMNCMTSLELLGTQAVYVFIPFSTSCKFHDCKTKLLLTLLQMKTTIIVFFFESNMT